ncbi:NADP-cytochrome b5 reductase [Biomphalaria glabrata]
MPAKAFTANTKARTRLSRKHQTAAAREARLNHLKQATTPKTSATTSNPSIVEPTVSASKRKLSFFSEENITGMGMAMPSTFVCLESLKSLFINLQCSSCGTQNLNLTHDPKKNSGLAIYLQVFCTTCQEVKGDTFTSPKSDKIHTVNRQVVAASLATGMGHAGLVKFSEIMNAPVLHKKSFGQHTKFVFSQSVGYVNQMLKESASTTGNFLKLEDPVKYQLWYNAHKQSCDINHFGSSGSMEQQAAVIMWSRSVEKNGFRYKSVISDGDTNTIKAIHEQNPYPDLVVEKRECLNHVSKRLGTALRNVVDTKKKQKITLGGNGKGKLTQPKINKLQKYFTKALRSSTTIPQMRKAIWATFYHCTSSDDNPMHSDCPAGKSSWCFYQRALARNQPAGSHEKEMTTFLSPLVAEHIRPVFERMTQDELLQRCILGQTQNVNESIHALIWSRCPKHLFVGRKRLEVSVGVGVGEFNMGSKASQLFLSHLNIKTGIQSKSLGLKRDCNRISKAQRCIEKNETKRRLSRKQAEERERQRIEQQEGGPQYIPGGADI